LANWNALTRTRSQIIHHDLYGTNRTRRIRKIKINLPRCRDRVCSETTDTPRKWNREKQDENDHKRDIFSTKTNKTT